MRASTDSGGLIGQGLGRAAAGALLSGLRVREVLVRLSWLSTEAKAPLPIAGCSLGATAAKVAGFVAGLTRDEDTGSKVSLPAGRDLPLLLPPDGGEGRQAGAECQVGRACRWRQQRVAGGRWKIITAGKA